MSAVFTPFASTFALHAENVSEVVGDLDVGTNSKRAVTTSPTSHNVCNHRGGLRAGGGCGGSFGGPDLAGLDMDEAPCCSVTED
jgi:hypothetical protein